MSNGSRGYRNRLEDVTTCTLFRKGEYRHLKWDHLGAVTTEGEGKISALRIPKAIEEIDAACVNPLDWDVVWLFYKGHVLDYSVSRSAPVRRARVNKSGDEIVADDVVMEIKKHRIFSLLPASFHNGITAAYVGDQKVWAPFRCSTCHQREWAARKTCSRCNGTSVVCSAKGHPIAPGAKVGVTSCGECNRLGVRPAPPSMLYVVHGGQRVGIQMTSVNSAQLALQSAYDDTKLRCAFNGIRGDFDRVGWIYEDNPKMEMMWWDAPERPEVKWKDYFGDFCPKAMVPASITVRPLTGTVAPRQLATVDDSDFTPPDTVVAIPGRSASFTSEGAAVAYLKGLPSGAYGSRKTEELRNRNRALSEYLTQDVNLPDFLRTFVPIFLPSSIAPDDSTDTSTAKFNRVVSDTLGIQMVIYVAPDFLALGNDLDWCRVTMSALAGQRVVDHYHCLYPTRRVALEVYDQCPHPQRFNYIGKGTSVRDGGPTSTTWTIEFHREIEAQIPRVDVSLGKLVAGPMKDVIISHVQYGARQDETDSKKKGDQSIHFWARRPGGGGYHGFGADAGSTDLPKLGHYYEVHNEYAMGLRMVYKYAYVRSTKGAWRQVTIHDLLADKNAEFKGAYKLLSSIPVPSQSRHDDYVIKTAKYIPYAQGM